MKKRIVPVVLLVVLVLSLGLTAAARWNYTTSRNPRLTYSGTTANCSVTIEADNDSSKITATLRLIWEKKDGSETEIGTWSNLSGTGILIYSTTKSVTSGETYRLDVDATVKAPGGTEYPYTYARAKCP